MPSVIDFAHCLSTDRGGRELPLSHVDPFHAIRYHFGMLLGVEDFETEQAYHRGKIRLHNAWLHREGVVWGLDVKPRDGSDPAALEPGELRVEPGLAIDAAGHELRLDGPACLSLPAWFARHEEEPALKAVTRASGTGAGKVFDAHVVMRFRACLTREVPALVEPCEGSVADTAFSRVAETVHLDLIPGLAQPPPPRREPGQPPPPPYRNLRILFGLAEPGADDTELAAELARVRAIADPAERARAARDAIRTLIALDGIALGPALDLDGTIAGLFPGREDAPIVLCDVRDVTLEPAAGGKLRLADLRVELAVRPSHVATATLQELVCALLVGAAPDPAAPRFVRAELVDATTIRLTADAPLATGTVVAGAFTVASHSTAPGDPWTMHAVTVAPPADPSIVTLTLPAPGITAGHRVRITARGTGPTPILGANLEPLAGGPSWPGGGAHDHVVTLTRS